MYVCIISVAVVHINDLQKSLLVLILLLHNIIATYILYADNYVA